MVVLVVEVAFVAVVSEAFVALVSITFVVLVRKDARDLDCCRCLSSCGDCSSSSSSLIGIGFS